MGIYLLLPAKDEAPALRKLIPEAQELGMRVVVCDDGSQDGTGAVARELGATVLTHEENRGLAEALKTLFRFATRHLDEEDVVLTMDADGTMPVMGGLKVAEALVLVDADIAIGSRFRPGGGEHGVPPLRRFLSRGARAYLSLMAGVPGITDYTMGLRAYRVRFLQEYEALFPLWFKSQGFSAQTELLVRAYWVLGARVVEVGVPVFYGAKEGPSKMRVLKTIREYLRLGWEAFLLRRREGERLAGQAGKGRRKAG